MVFGMSWLCCMLHGFIYLGCSLAKGNPICAFRKLSVQGCLTLHHKVCGIQSCVCTAVSQISIELHCFAFTSVYAVGYGFAGVILLLWGPPPPSQQSPSSGDKTLAAQQAATAYLQTFEQVVEMPSALGTSQHALALHSWNRFLARWLAAAKASQGRTRGDRGGLAETQGECYMH